MSRWSLVTLGEVAPLSYGKALSEPQRNAGSVPVYGSAGVTGWHDEALVDGPAIIVGRKGNVGSVFYEPGSCFPIDTVFFTHGSPGCDLRFLYYKLTSLSLLKLSRDSAVPGLNRDEAHSLETAVPPLPKQRAIAEVLGAFDDKIAANTKLIGVADELMFLQFRAAAVRGSQQPLSASADFINGKAFTKGASGTGRVVIRISELNSGIGGSTVFSDAEVPEVHVACPGDILFAWSGSLTLHRWFREPGIVNQHIFKVVPHDGYPNWLVYELVRAKLDEFKGIAADKATTMGHIQRRHLDELVRVPSRDAIQGLDTLMESLWDTALTAERENLSLAATRDALLPQLMSGKLRVKDAEQLVSEVV